MFMLKAPLVLRALFVSTAMSVVPVSAATFDVTKGDWGDSSTINSFAWAINQANATPGSDSIRLFSDVSVDRADPVEPISGFLAELTDRAGVTIQGNGHSLVGNPVFIDNNGYIINKNFPRKYSPMGGDQLMTEAVSFARISDQVSNVLIDRLNVDGLNAFLDVGKGSEATIVDSTIKNAVAFGRMARSVINAQSESTVNLTRVVLNKLNPFSNSSFGTEFIWETPAISGEDATLNIVKSKFELATTSSTAGAVDWLGGTANVVSSVILGQGLSIADYTKEGVLNLVNSVVRPAGGTATARIQAWAGGVANVIASTLQFDAFESTIPNREFCPQMYPCNGAPLQVFDNGEIRLQSSAVSVLNEDFTGISYPYLAAYDTQAGTPLAGIFAADLYSYVQPVANQNAVSLRLLFGQPNLITASGAYLLDPSSNPLVATYYDLPNGAYPNPSGPLVGVIPDADTLNQLINPIDGSVISTDVFGSPRTYNNRRDVGAVQQIASVPGPLPLLGFGSAFGWSRRLRRRLGERPSPPRGRQR
jgi:hypothetical protein